MPVRFSFCISSWQHIVFCLHLQPEGKRMNWRTAVFFKKKKNQTLTQFLAYLAHLRMGLKPYKENQRCLWILHCLQTQWRIHRAGIAPLGFWLSVFYLYPFSWFPVMSLVGTMPISSHEMHLLRHSCMLRQLMAVFFMLQSCEPGVAWWHLFCLPKAWSVIVYQASHWPWLTHEPSGCWSSPRRHSVLTFSAQKHGFGGVHWRVWHSMDGADEVVLVTIFLSSSRGCSYFHCAKSVSFFPVYLVARSHYYDESVLIGLSLQDNSVPSFFLDSGALVFSMSAQS